MDKEADELLKHLGTGEVPAVLQNYDFFQDGIRFFERLFNDTETIIAKLKKGNKVSDNYSKDEFTTEILQLYRIVQLKDFMKSLMKAIEAFKDNPIRILLPDDVSPVDINNLISNPDKPIIHSEELMAIITLAICATRGHACKVIEILELPTTKYPEVIFIQDDCSYSGLRVAATTSITKQKLDGIEPEKQPLISVILGGASKKALDLIDRCIDSKDKNNYVRAIPVFSEKIVSRIGDRLSNDAQTVFRSLSGDQHTKLFDEFATITEFKIPDAFSINSFLTSGNPPFGNQPFFLRGGEKNYPTYRTLLSLIDPYLKQMSS